MRCAGVEGTSGYGAGLARHLRAKGIEVLVNSLSGLDDITSGDVFIALTTFQPARQARRSTRRRRCATSSRRS